NRSGPMTLDSKLVTGENPSNKRIGFVGCEITKNPDKPDDVEFMFASVPLGRLASEDGGAIDQRVLPTLQIDENWSWFVSGINVKSGVVRIYRQTSTELYTSRQSPESISSNKSPEPSDAEMFFRQCHKATGAGGRFKLFGLRQSASWLNSTSVSY